MLRLEPTGEKKLVLESYFANLQINGCL